MPTHETKPARHRRSAPSDRRGIQSVEIGLRMVEALAAAPGAVSLKELGHASGVSPSKGHRYLVSLIRSGLAVQHEGTALYDLGPLAIQVGLAALNRLDAVKTGMAAVTQLVDQSGHTAALAVWGQRGAVIIRWLNGRDAVFTTLSTGDVLSVTRSATGRTFQAFLPKHLTEPLVRAELASLRRRGQPIDRRAMDEIVGRARSDRFTKVAGDFIPGLSAAASPILDAHGEAAAVLTMVTDSRGLNEAAIKLLVSTAAQASTELGWKG